MMRTSFWLPGMLAGMLFVSAAAQAAEDAPTLLVMHNGQFSPAQLAVRAGVRVKLLIRNQDDLPAEFESYSLSRELVVPPHADAVVYVGPLEPGSYAFFNDFNHAMQGAIVAGSDAKQGN